MFLAPSILVFTIFLTLQVIILLIFLKAFSSKKRSKKSSNQPVSVVIAARNELENLKMLLPKLYSQGHDNFEIVIVDDRSDDGTYDFLYEENKSQPLLKVVTVKDTPNKMNPKKYALTLGIKAAKNEIILLTDADCIPESDQWIENMTINFGNPSTEINLGVSLYQKQKGLLNAFIRFETITTAIQYIGLALSGLPYMSVGRNLAYRKDLFLKNKGFNSHIDITGGDDDLFVNKHATNKNTTVSLGSEALIYSIPKASWPDFFRQKIRHLSVGKHYKFKHKLILGLISLTHLGFWAALIFSGVLLMEPYILLSGFILRTLLLYLTFMTACKKFGVRFDLWGLVFLDFIFVFYYLSIGIRALFTKRVRWS
ncbi:glycosyltransferase [Fulvivirga lutimaris]|uniref:glycosyltransferase n=1 Tax=Fulvivirga lutimaris TaxID=1819566 RepID=UPI0012BB9693|nr:glycosyltransferase [Fulvivirga lutimaris]MTI39922.1 glycosyltransferase [Fulvivirga lutimaris]